MLCVHLSLWKWIWHCCIFCKMDLTRSRGAVKYLASTQPHECLWVLMSSDLKNLIKFCSEVIYSTIKKKEKKKAYSSERCFLLCSLAHMPMLEKGTFVKLFSSFVLARIAISHSFYFLTDGSLCSYDALLLYAIFHNHLSLHATL